MKHEGFLWNLRKFFRLGNMPSDVFADAIGKYLPEPELQKLICYKTDKGGGFETSSIDIPNEQTITWNMELYDIKSLNKGELTLELKRKKVQND